MGLSEEGEETILQRFEELCLDLNMDVAAKQDAWINYQKIIANYSLEGDQLHWLACALYEACRHSSVPTVGRGTVEGNCVSLTRLLRSSKFSLIQFFNKMRKWSDMAALSKAFRDKIDKLERNFAVSTVIFKKFEPIFLDIFVNPATEAPRQPRGRKQRRHPCTANEVFKFSWTMFIQVKGSFPAISDDLVNSYHLLLCCIDWFFSNAIISGRKDIFNPDFTGLPEGFHQPGWKGEAEAPCIMQLLCERHDGLVVEAKTIKEHWWKPHIKRLFEKKVLKGKVDSLASILDIGNFEENVKMVNNMYEEYVLSVGDFDERIFLGEDANEEIGTPGATSNASDLAEQMQAKRSLKQHFDDTRSLTPSTPLTGRRYLKEKDPSVTPVSTATQSVSRLQSLLSGTKTSPTDALKENLKGCSQDPTEDILKRVKEMSETFCKHYIKPTENDPGAHIDFARKRLQLGESLYFKILEVVVEEERKRLENRTDKDQKIDLLGLMENDLFHRSLFACCLEIVIFSYNSQRTFPWIVDMFELNAYHFYKVIEIIIRAEKGLSRDVVKHLNHIEESILESLAWKSDSPLWEAIKDTPIPACGEVMPAHHFEGHHVSNSKSCQTNSMKHPRLRSLVGEVKVPNQKDLLLSPSTPSVADRFSSPTPGNAKRRLFDGPSVSTLPFPHVTTSSTTPTITVISSTTHASVLAAPSCQSGVKSILRNQLKGGLSDTLLVSNKMASQLAPTTCQGSTTGITDVNVESSTTEVKSGSKPQQAIVAVMEDGRQILIPVQIAQPTGASASESSASSSFASSYSATSSAASSFSSSTSTTLSTSLSEGSSVPATVECHVVKSGQTMDDHNYMKPKKTGSLALFFRKVYHLASVRLRDLCEKLDIEDDDLIKKIWTCFERVMVNHVHLMCDRHLDQIVMCSMYLMAKVRDKSLTFQNIMKCYRLQPQAQSHVYRSVLLFDRKRHSSGSSDSSKSNAGSGPSSPVNSDVKMEKEKDKKLVRSSSTLPVPNPSSQPPTPTKGASAQPAFDFEDERGDLIQFYNQVLVKKIRSFALKFADRNGDQTNTPKLSPMPAVRCLAASPRRVSNTHHVFISPHPSNAIITTPKSMCYSINRSPSKDLQAINKMIRQGMPKSATKRMLEVDHQEDSVHSPAKCMAPSNVWQRRLKDLQVLHLPTHLPTIKKNF